MKIFNFTQTLLDLISELDGFSVNQGLAPISQHHVVENKLGSKFFYSIKPETLLAYRRVCKVILNNYLRKIPLNQAACAYIEGKSYLDFLEPHRNNYFFLRLDIKSFFNSIGEDLLRSNLIEYFSTEQIPFDSKQKFSDVIFNLLSYKIPNDAANISFRNKIVLPIGFPLSPVVSNIVFRKIDIILERMCSENSITYTRYADDMLFSSRGLVGEKNTFSLTDKAEIKDKAFLHADKFIASVESVLSIDGFKLNHGKTVSAKRMISLNGYTISGVNNSDEYGYISVSNKKTKIIEKLLHELSKTNVSDVNVFKICFSSVFPVAKYKRGEDGFVAKYCTDQINNKLIGYKSFLVSFHKYNSLRNCIEKGSLTKYGVLIDRINKVLEARIRK